jgi:hypothetical protein
MREQCLKLTLACLSYDFFGTSSDETTEDVGTVQVWFQRIGWCCKRIGIGVFTPRGQLYGRLSDASDVALQQLDCLSSWF